MINIDISNSAVVINHIVASVSNAFKPGVMGYSVSRAIKVARPKLHGC